MPTLYIVEEYGYRYWTAELTEPEYEQLVARWKTMKGLHCCVPVRFIIPQAVVSSWLTIPEPGWIHCHIHEHDDSFLGDLDYVIPPSSDDTFTIDGTSYSYEEIVAIMRQTTEREKEI